MSPSRIAAQQSTGTGTTLGQVAYASVVLASYAQLTLSRRLSGEAWQIPAVFVLGMVYAAVAILSARWTETGAPRAIRSYYLFQFLICCALIGLSPNRSFFWILVLPLAAQSIFDLRWPWALSLNLALYALAVAGIWFPYGRSAGFEVMIGFAPAFIFTAIFSYLTRNAFQARQRAEELRDELEQANAQLRQQSEQTEELATSRERNRVAREIHDGLGHYLTVINVQLEAARALLERNPAGATDPLNKALRLSREALDDVRHSVTNLRRETKPVPLVQQLEALCRDGCLPATCTVEGPPREMSTAVVHALFRAAQEGLTNVRKHAAGACATLTIDFRDASWVTLQLKDDGPGTTREVNGHTGFGLRGMRERIELLGGEVGTASRAGEGFELTVVVPA